MLVTGAQGAPDPSINVYTTALPHGPVLARRRRRIQHRVPHGCGAIELPPNAILCARTASRAPPAENDVVFNYRRCTWGG